MSTCHKNPEKTSTTKINKLQVIHLIQQKISLIVIETKTVWKYFVRI